MAIQNSKTRLQTRLILGRSFLGPDFLTGTSTGGSTTTIVDSGLNGQWAADYFNNRQIRNSTVGFTTVVSDYTAAGTFTIPTQSASATGETYEVWNRAAATVEDANDAIDLAIQSVVHKMLEDVDDDTLVFERNRSLYTIPTSFSYLARVYADLATFHRLKQPPSSWDTLLALRDAAARTKIAQSFVPRTNNPSFQLGTVYLMLAKVGTPTGNISVTIEGNSSSAPDGTAIATSANVDVSGLTTEPTFQQFTFTAKPRLVKDTTYWIVLQGTFTISTSNYAVWANDSTDAGYGDGSITKNDGSAWTTQAGDLCFILRNPQPNLILLERGKDWEVLSGGTKYLHITPSGRSKLSSYDGSVLRLWGQGAPGLPSADTTTLDVPFDYVVAHAGLELHNRNPAWMSNRPNANAVIAGWLRKIEEAEHRNRTQIHAGSYKVNDL